MMESAIVTGGVRRVTGSLWALLAALWGCGGSDDVSGSLVDVAGHAIDAAELRAYRAKLPEALLPAGEPRESIRSLLESLVDGRIMVMEAEALSLHRDPEFLDRQYRLLSAHLVEAVVQRQVGPNVQVTDDDVRRLYEKSHWDREVLPAHILSATEADAREVIRLLGEGRDFGEVARERSIAPDASSGGFLGQYFGPDDAAPELVEAAHGLPAGEFTREPVRTRDGFEVVKILDAKPIPLEAVRTKLSRAIYMGRFGRERREFLAGLEQRFGVTYHPEGLGALLRAARAGTEPSPAEQELPLVTFGGDHVLPVSQALAPILADRRLAAADTAQIERAIGARLLADSLFVLEARRAGLDTTVQFNDFRDRLYERMLVTLLRKREVLDRIAVTEEEVRQGYEQNRSDYSIPDQVDVRVIAVATRREAADLLQRIRAGQDPEGLARTHSLRPDAARTGGHEHVTEGDREKWGTAFEQIWGAAEGDLLGPLEVSDGFLVLRVEALRRGQYRSLDEMRLAVTHRLKLAKQDAAFEEYIAGLRQRYADRVTWHDARIDRLASLPDWHKPPPVE